MIKKIKDIKVNGTKLEFTLCHQKPERSFFWKGKQFPFCARCTGIYLPYIIFPLFMFGIIKISLFWSIILIIPTYIDGLIQAYFNIESTNTRRFITGTISGIGTVSLLTITGVFLGNQILKIIN